MAMAEKSTIDVNLGGASQADIGILVISARRGEYSSESVCPL